MPLDLDLTPVAAPTLTGVSAVATLKGILIAWDALNDSSLFGAEVWVSATNDRSTATLLATVTTNYYLHTGLASNVTRYYWVRAKNVYMRVDGAWTPASSTAGVSATTLLTGTSDIAANAVTTVTNIQSSSSISQTAYSTWESPLAYSMYGAGAILRVDMQHLQNHTLTTIGTSGQCSAENLFQVVEHVLYNTGTVAVTNGSAVVTGTGTAWLANAAPGKTFQAPNGVRYTISTVDSDTQITLTATYGGTTASGQGYNIFTASTVPAQIQSEIVSYEIRGSHLVSGQIPFNFRLTQPTVAGRLYDFILYWRLLRDNTTWDISQSSFVRILAIEEIKR